MKIRKAKKAYKNGIVVINEIITEINNNDDYTDLPNNVSEIVRIEDIAYFKTMQDYFQRELEKFCKIPNNFKNYDEN